MDASEIEQAVVKTLKADPELVRITEGRIYHTVTCWLCGGNGPVCDCHSHPPGKKPAPCNMGCNPPKT